MLVFDAGKSGKKWENKSRVSFCNAFNLGFDRNKYAFFIWLVLVGWFRRSRWVRSLEYWMVVKMGTSGAAYYLGYLVIKESTDIWRCWGIGNGGGVGNSQVLGTLWTSVFPIYKIHIYRPLYYPKP